MSFGSVLRSNWVQNIIDSNNEHRSSFQTSYLDRAITETTLTVYTHALTKRVIFSSSKTATGIEVVSGDLTYALSTAKVVVRSAGALNLKKPCKVSIFQSPPTSPELDKTCGTTSCSWTSYAVNVEISTVLMNTSSPYNYAAEYSYANNGTRSLTNAAPYLGWEKLPQPQRSNLTNSALEALPQFPSDCQEWNIWCRQYTAARYNHQQAISTPTRDFSTIEREYNYQLDKDARPTNHQFRLAV